MAVVIVCLTALFIIVIGASLLAPYMVSTEGQSVESKLSLIPPMRQLVHKWIQHITGTNVYIKPLPTVTKKMFGRDEKLKKIIDYVVREDFNVMIVGRPGFGKSMLAKLAGHQLNEKNNFYVSYVDATEHFSMTSTIPSIRLFYDILASWCNARTKQTILILDNFDVLLKIKEKRQLFQKNFLSKIESAHNLSMIVTTQKETLNDNFRIVSANELSREASIELLSLSNVPMSNDQKNETSSLVEDSPLALQVVLKLIDVTQSNTKVADPVNYIINKLNESKIKGEISDAISDDRLEDEEKYNYILNIAFNQLKKQPQCCGCCISNYPGSFSEDLFPITADHYGVPCNDSTFKECVNDLVQNSLLDLFSYVEDHKSRYKMHGLIQSYFYKVSRMSKSIHTCEKSYRLMFSVLFSKCCALSYYYTEKDLNEANKILTNEYHHFKQLLSYILKTKSLNKYEGTILMIAHQCREIQSKYGYKMLFEAVCKCKECTEYSKSLMGVEAFGSIVRNVSEELFNFNFLRCDFMSDNFCSKELLNSPVNSTTHEHMSSSDVRTVVCTCFLMSRFHILGTLSVLGALPLFYLLTVVKLIPLKLKLDASIVIFIYLNFLPSVIKLYFSTEFQRMLFNITESPLLKLMFAQMLYEGLLICAMGHMLQQRDVFYATNVKAFKFRNVAMLLTYFGLVIALLWSDLLGMYTIDAVKFSLGIIVVLLGARYTLFDYVMGIISSGIFLRFFLRFILGLLSLSSLFLCQTFYFETSFIIESIFWVVSLLYMVAFSGLTIPIFYHLKLMTFEYY